MSSTTCSSKIDEIKETIEAWNDRLDDDEQMYSNESKEESKDIKSQPVFLCFGNKASRDRFVCLLVTNFKKV